MIKYMFVISLILSIFSLFPLNIANPAYVCYPKVGCFDNKYPWQSFARPVPLPEPPEKISTFTYFYSREYPNGAVFSIFPNTNATSECSHKNLTFIILHGFSANGRQPWIIKLKNTLLEKRNANVFVPDYGLESFSYEQTVSNGRVFVRLMINLLESLRIPVRSLHIIGHSMGAQFASFLAEDYKKLGTGVKIGQITGLDPAGPFFEYSPVQTHLDATDAEFVDILHTCPGPRGQLYPSGHVDFYFNGDQLQPGCLDNPNPVMCSHNVSVHYFQEAVEFECFFGFPGVFQYVPGNEIVSPVVVQGSNLTKIPVGLGTVNYPERGVFLVHTRPEPPFCPVLS